VFDLLTNPEFEFIISVNSGDIPSNSGIFFPQHLLSRSTTFFLVSR
jgi:hypothetical protein